MSRPHRLVIPALCLLALCSPCPDVAIAGTPPPGHTLGLPAGAPPGPPSAPAGPVPVHISGMKTIGPDQVLLLLSDEKEERAVPISVGRDQGVAIYLGKMKAGTPRPMTHDLLSNMLTVLGATIEKITVTELKESVYYAEISLKRDGKVHPVDARPSDAIALAVRAGAPMFAAPSLLRRLDSLLEPEETRDANLDTRKAEVLALMRP